MQKAIILLVEDDSALLDGMSDTLEYHGYKTIQAGNGVEGLQVLEQVHPDLIISDIMMPEMDGYDFHSEVVSRDETATIPFIFLTAKSDQSDVLKGLREGVDAYLTKPFDLEELLIHVQNKLRRFATIRQQALSQLEELRYQIVNMMSHELRTPLTYIEGYTELLSSGAQQTTQEEMELFLRGLRTGAGRLHKVIDSLLTLVHLDTGIYQKEFREYAVIEDDISQFVRMVAVNFEREAAKKGLSIQVEIEENLAPVRILEGQYVKALSCLLDNAVKFSPTPGSQILIRVYQTEGRVCTDVVDEGIGIAPEDMTRAFERLEQIGRDRQEQSGVGVGLPIAQGLARVHGGDVMVESRLGKGSRFTLWLPGTQHPDD